MVLFVALGFAARYALAFGPGVGVGILAGLVIANFVPARGGCGARASKPHDLGD